MRAVPSIPPVAMEHLPLPRLFLLSWVGISAFASLRYQGPPHLGRGGAEAMSLGQGQAAPRPSLFAARYCAAMTGSLLSREAW
jgi:hypothetical protein